MADALYRQWNILCLLSPYPRGITISKIIDKLIERAVTVPHYRTIDRDLKKLSSVFLLQCESREGTFYWSTDADKIIQIPQMDPSAALALCLAKQQLQVQMPSDALEHLEPYFNTAAQLLDKRESHYAQWRDKLRVLPQTQQLIPPNIDSRVSSIVYSALLENRRFKAKYVKRGEDMPTNYLISPLGLVFHGTVTYLVGSMRDDWDPIPFALHRFVEAEMTEQERFVPPNFNLDEYVTRGKLDYLVSDISLELEVLVDKQVTDHLRESMLAEDQQLTLLESGKSLIKATVRDTGQLRWWLLGFGEHVEVLKPEWLREEFKEKAAKMNARYSENRK